MKKTLIALLALPLLLSGCKVLNSDTMKSLLTPETLQTVLEVNRAIGQQIKANRDQSVMIGNTKVTPKGNNPGFEFNYGGAQRINGEPAVVFELVNKTQNTFKSLSLANSSSNGGEYCYALNANGNSYGKCDVYLIETRTSDVVTIKNVAPNSENLGAVFVPNVPANATGIATVNLGITCVGPDGKVYNFSYLLENVQIDQ